MKNATLILSLLLVAAIVYQNHEPVVCGTAPINYKLEAPQTKEGIPAVVPSDYVGVRVVRLAFFAPYRIDPKTIDSVNLYFSRTGLFFEIDTIQVVQAGLTLDDSFDDWQKESNLKKRFNREDVINAYVLPSFSRLRGYVPMPQDTAYISEYNGLFLHSGFNAQTLGHELGHFYSLNHGTHCADLMAYSKCASIFTDPDIERIKVFRWWRRYLEK